MLKIENLRKVFRTDEIETIALDNVSFAIEKGEFVAIVGQSGSGKSTCMNIIGCLDVPTHGTYRLNGRDVGKMSRNELAAIRNEMLGFIFQQYNLLPRLNLMENVEVPLVYAGIGRTERHARAKEGLEQVGLGDKLRNRPNQLSGGQQQRVALARALVLEPGVLLFDEPLSNLDAKLRVEMQVEIKRIQKELGITTIIVTHDHEEAVSLADRVIVMNAGHILQIGKPQEVFDRPASPFIADFMGFSTFLHGIAAGAEGDMRLIRCGAHTLQVPAEAAQELTEGDACILAIRSENIRTAEQEGVNTVRGTVKSATYKGHTTRLEVSGCFEEMVYPAIHEYADVQEGSEVLLHFPAQHFCVYKDIK